MQSSPCQPLIPETEGTLASPAVRSRPSFCQTWVNRSGGEIILQPHMLRNCFVDLEVTAYFDAEGERVILEGRRVSRDRLPREILHFFGIARELGSTKIAINGNKIAIGINNAAWQAGCAILQGEADRLYQAGVYLAS